MANILYENGFPIKAIVNGKLVDGQEVRHGRWIEQEADMDTIYECSVCGEPFVTIDGTPADNLWHYCPNCGAKMDEEDQPKRFWPEQVEKIMIEAIAKAATHKDTEEDPDDETL